MAGKSASEELISFQLHLLSLQGRIQGEGAGGAHPPPWDDLRPLSN